MVLFNTPDGPKPQYSPSDGSFIVTWYPATIKGGKLVPIQINEYTLLTVGTGEKFTVGLSESYDGGETWDDMGSHQGYGKDHIISGGPSFMTPNAPQRWSVNGQRVQVVFGSDPKTGSPILYWQLDLLRENLPIPQYH